MAARRPCPIATRTTPERKQELDLLRQRLGLETMSALIDRALDELLEQDRAGGVYLIKDRELIDEVLEFIRGVKSGQILVNASHQGDDEAP